MTRRLDCYTPREGDQGEKGHIGYKSIYRRSLSTTSVDFITPKEDKSQRYDPAQIKPEILL